MNLEQTSNECEDKLKELQCPFAWDMDSIVEVRNRDETLFSSAVNIDGNDRIITLELIKLLVDIYIRIKANDSSVREDLKKLDEIMATIATKTEIDGISVPVIRHIADATKCYVWLYIGDETKAKDILKSIVIFQDVISRSMLMGCRAIAWFVSSSDEWKKVDKFCQLAHNVNPNCALWMFILGLNLRRTRRIKMGLDLSRKEVMYFTKAYEKSPNPKYAIFAAQALRLCDNKHKALELYKAAFQSGNLCDESYLRLALGFIRCYALSEARECLDIVSTRCECSRLYLAYEGLYYLKIKQFKNATNFLKRAIDQGNYYMLENYIFSSMKSNRTFDGLEFLIEILKRNDKNLLDLHKQCVAFHIAMEYYTIYENMSEVLRYCHTCFEIDPKFLSYKGVFVLDGKWSYVNVYEKLKSEMMLTIESQRESLNVDSMNHLKYLQNLLMNFKMGRFSSKE